MIKGKCKIIVAIGIIIAVSSCHRPNEVKKQEINAPEGWVYSPNNAFVKYISAKESTPEYELLISRPKDQNDLYYVSIAESVFPNLSTYQKIVNSGKKRADSSKVTNWYFERLWWSEIFEGFKIPYAITSDCISYYIAKYADRKKGIKETNENTEWQGSIENRVTLSYQSSVDNNEGKEGLKKVKMELKWYYFCGQTCGWGFTKTREVLFSSPLNIVKISGDVPIDIWIASEEKPYAPDQWITY